MTVPIWQFGDPEIGLAQVLAAGGLLAVPTESSYGLAAAAADPEGIAAVYRLKEREAGKPLPVVAADAEQIRALGVHLPPALERRLERLWPGAVTVVLPLADPAAGPAAAAGGDSLAVRVPGHPGLRALVHRLGPLTATSANRSGETPVVDPAAAAELLAAADVPVALIDGGRLAGGPPSTLVRWLPDGGTEVLREGAVPADEVVRALSDDADDLTQ